MATKCLAFVAAILIAVPALGGTYSISTENCDDQKIYWGSARSFDKAGEVSYESVIKATPEYSEIKKSKVERGTAKYWQLMSQASERAVKVIVEVGQETDYDLIAAHGYLGSLDPPIPVEDITAKVLDKLHGRDAAKEKTAQQRHEGRKPARESRVARTSSRGAGK